MRSGAFLMAGYSRHALISVFLLTTSGLALAQSVDLSTIDVQAPASRESPYGPVDGYVATQSTTATKTDTPLIETPQSISVVTSDQMKAQGSPQNISQALRYTPGIAGELYGQDARGIFFQIRGFANGNDSIFYRDGLSMRGSSFSSFMNLDPYGSERLEVARGPASLLYGQGEPSGIINYVSKRPLEKPFHEIEGVFGNYNHFQGQFDLSGPANAEKTLFYRLTGLVRDNDSQVDFVGQNRIFLAPAFTWKPNADTTLTVLSSFQRDRNGWDIQFYPARGTLWSNPNGHIPSSRFLGEPGFDAYEPIQYSTGYAFEHRASNVWTFRQNFRYAGFQNNNQSGVFGNGGAGFGLQPDNMTYVRYGDFAQSQMHSLAVDNQAEAKFVTGPLRHTLLLGLDQQYYNFHDFGRSVDGAAPIDIFNPDYGTSALTLGRRYQDTYQTQVQTGLYFQDQIKLDRWVLSFGLRYDMARTISDDYVGTGTSATQSDAALTGRAGLLYLFDNGFAPYASYATSFLPQLGTGADLRPFKPETGEQFEVGIKYQPPGMNAFITVAAFDLTRQNVLTMDPNNPNFMMAAGEIRSRGIEVEATASLGSGWNLKAAYTYLDTVFTESNDGIAGNTPYAIPRHQFAAWADHTFKSGPLAGFGAGAGVRAKSETFGNDKNTFEVPGVVLFDAGLHYDWKQFRLALNVRNLLDEEYVASCYDVRFGCFYGERRKVLLSARYRW